MSVIVTAKELGEIFYKAHLSLWDDHGFGFGPGGSISVPDQIRIFRKKFNATLSGGHFDHTRESSKTNEWNTKDAIIKFRSKKAYVLFMMEWS